MAPEFSEIGNCGGEIKLVYDDESCSVSLQYSLSKPTPASLFQVGTTLDGSKIEYWPIHGMGRPKPEPPMVPVFVVSDMEGLFGRSCPSCHSYFRTRIPGEIMNCPYCGHQDHNTVFSTKNQLEFISKIRSCWLQAIEEKKDLLIDLDGIAKDLPENIPAWNYSEETQQNKYSCTECRNTYDILGEYSCCPNCRKRNSLEVFERKISDIENQLCQTDDESPDSNAREIEWGNLTHCISEFEAMAKDIAGQLALFPSISSRRKEIQRLSFQQLSRAGDSLKDWFGIKLFRDISEPDKTFLNIMINRRHIFIHNAGRVDQFYLEKSGDKSVRLNQKIVVKGDEMEKLIPILRKCAQNLFQDFESIE